MTLAAALLGAALAAPPSASLASPASSYAEIDEAYFHRNQAGLLERSSSLLEARLAENPGDSAALWRYGRALVRLGERRGARAERLDFFDRAKKAAERSLELNEACAEAHYWWGVAAGRVGQERGMLRAMFLVGPIREHMRRALALDPGLGPAHQVLGEMLRRLPAFAGGSKTKAASELEAAVRASPGYTAAYVALAEARLDLKDKEGARSALRKALEIAVPDDPGEHEENLADARRMLDGF